MDFLRNGQTTTSISHVTKMTIQKEKENLFYFFLKLKDVCIYS
jgi:hypothetical protein